MNDQNPSMKLKNSDVLVELDRKVNHLGPSETDYILQVIREYPELFSDVPSRTNLVEHDVDVGDTVPIKQHPYRTNPEKSKTLSSEVEYMLDNNIIERSSIVLGVRHAF